MSIYAKALSELTTADLQELLDDGAVENVRLEFKSEVPGKDETLKKLSSFANTFGGYMVVGARARSSDGRIEGLPGVDPQSGYRQKVVDWCFGGASPPLAVEVSDPIATPAADGKVCYVAYIAESDLAPHFLNDRKGVWVRTDGFSARCEARLADDNELRHLFDRRKLIQERRAGLLRRAKQRFERYATNRARELNAKPAWTGKENKLGANLTVSVVPRFPARPLVAQSELRSLVKNTAVNWRQVGFPKPYNPMVSQHESVLVLHPEANFSLFEFNVWGMLFYGSNLESVERDGSGIHLGHLAGCVLLYIMHSANVLRKLAYSGPILIEVGLASMLGVPWLYPQGGWLDTRQGSVLDEDATFSIGVSTEDMLARPDGLAMEALSQIAFSANFPEIVDTSQNLEQLIRYGYEYNFWNAPAALRV